MRRADCHPDRVHEARGLCGACYQAAWKAGTLGPLPKVPSPAHSCGRGHEPGSTCYVNCKCRCRGCRDARAEAERRRSRAKAYGTFQPHVDAEPVRAHVHQLLDAGMGTRTIAARSGVARSALQALLNGRNERDTGPSRYVTRATAEKLYGIDMVLADGATVHAAPTRRKLDAMLAGGFTKAELGRYVTGDVRTRTLQLVPTGRGRTTVSNARKVDRLFRDWKAGRIVPRGRRSRWEHGPPSPFPATPAPRVAEVKGIVNDRCEHCGAESLAGGRWCLDHIAAAARVVPTRRAA